MLHMHYVQGGGESIVQLFERCKSALLRIGRNHKGIVSFHIDSLCDPSYSFNCHETYLMCPFSKFGSLTIATLD